MQSAAGLQRHWKSESQFYHLVRRMADVYCYCAEKDSKIDLAKIDDYIQALSVYGAAQLNENYVKHLDGDSWKLRPIRDRILFAGVVGGRYVLLHQFMKQTQKTLSREIERANRELADFMERSGSYE